MTAINLNSTADHLQVHSAKEAVECKTKSNEQPSQRLRSQKSLSRMDDNGLVQSYKAWMHCRNGKMPSEKTLTAFEGLSRAEKIDLIVRLKVKVRRERRTK